MDKADELEVDNTEVDGGVENAVVVENAIELRMNMEEMLSQVRIQITSQYKKVIQMMD